MRKEWGSLASGEVEAQAVDCWACSVQGVEGLTGSSRPGEKCSGKRAAATWDTTPHWRRVGG